MFITKQVLAGIVTVLTSLSLFLSGLHVETTSPALGGIAPGFAITVASTTLEAVGPGPVTLTQSLFSTTTNCTSRTITTYANPITLTFSDYAAQLPTALFGHLQSASTTTNYPAEVYGCNLWRAYGFAATTSITVTEFR